MTDTNSLREKILEIMATCKWSESGAIADQAAADQIIGIFNQHTQEAVERARVEELEWAKSQITDAHMILSPCGYRHTIENILLPEEIEERIKALTQTKGGE